MTCGVFLNSMIQAEKLGIPIADVLRVQASEMRLKKSQRTEEQAMKLPVKLVFPLMLGIMPALFIVILGPAAIRIYEQIIGGIGGTDRLRGADRQAGGRWAAAQGGSTDRRRGCA